MRLAVIYIALTLSLFPAGCSTQPDQENPADSAFYSLGTAPPGGTFFVVGSALVDILNTAGWQFSAEATKGSQENIRRLVRGELNLALSNSSITYFAVRGEEGWDQAYSVKAVMTLAPNVAFFVTPGNSGIRQISDLRGHRVVVGVAGAGFEYFVRPILAEHGVSYEDFTPLYNTQAGSVDMLADGSAAAAFLGGGVPTASVTQAATTQEVFFVPFGEQERRQLVEHYPFFAEAVVPAGTYPGQEEDFQGLDVGSMHLITSAEAPEEFIYRLTRSLYENRQDIATRHPVGKAVQPGNVARYTGTDFHPGAVRFYKEIGVWRSRP